MDVSLRALVQRQSFSPLTVALTGQCHVVTAEGFENFAQQLQIIDEIDIVFEALHLLQFNR